MDSVVVLTGTLTARLDGSGQDFAVYLPMAGVAVIGWAGAFALLLMLFIIAQRFQMWALLTASVCALFYAPFALTVYAPYIIILLLVSVVFGTFVRFAMNIFSGGRRRRAPVRG